MANFKISEAITGGNEGGYANVQGDHGGETYAGIARKFWPNWPGWPMIDTIKKTAKTPKAIDNAVMITAMPIKLLVSQFYKINFWDTNKLDLVNDQQIANNVYDCGVNSGAGYAAKVLQVAAKVKVDGVVGSDTIRAVNALNPVTVYNSINEQRVAKYTLLAKEPGQAQFLKGWLSRIKPYKV